MKKYLQNKSLTALFSFLTVTGDLFEPKWTLTGQRPPSPPRRTPLEGPRQAALPHTSCQDWNPELGHHQQHLHQRRSRLQPKPSRAPPPTSERGEVGVQLLLLLERRRLWDVWWPQWRYAGVEIRGGGEVLRGRGGAGGHLDRLLHVQLLDDLLGFHGLVGRVRARGG